MSCGSTSRGSISGTGRCCSGSATCRRGSSSRLPTTEGGPLDTPTEGFQIGSHAGEPGKRDPSGGSSGAVQCAGPGSGGERLPYGPRADSARHVPRDPNDCAQAGRCPRGVGCRLSASGETVADGCAPGSGPPHGEDIVRGQGRVYERGGVWWIDYGLHGQRFRESTHGTSKREAFDLLRQRVGDRKAGKLTGNPDKVTFADLRHLIEQDYALKGNRSTDRLADALGHLEQFFGARELTRAITVKRVDEYAAGRRTGGAARATVAYERAILRRAF